MQWSDCSVARCISPQSIYKAFLGSVFMNGVHDLLDNVARWWWFPSAEAIAPRPTRRSVIHMALRFQWEWHEVEWFRGARVWCMMMPQPWHWWFIVISRRRLISRARPSLLSRRFDAKLFSVCHLCVLRLQAATYRRGSCWLVVDLLLALYTISLNNSLDLADVTRRLLTKLRASTGGTGDNPF